MNTQLLCTFCTTDTLDSVVASISSKYTIAFNTIYVLSNVDVENALCCTYNIEIPEKISNFPEYTISLHRKKMTNTLYTINALNTLIKTLNNGVVDKNFKVDWNEYQNCILVTAGDKLKKINTKLNNIIKLP